MRRALLLFIAATPTLALGQAAGAVIVSTNSNSTLTAINIAQCSGVEPSVPPLSDDMTGTISWTITPVPNVTVPASSVYRVYVSKTQSQAGQTLTSSSTTGSSCQEDTGNNPITATQLGGDQTVTGTTQTLQNISLSSIVSAAGLSCTGATQVNFYVCVQQVDTSNNTNVGYATLILSLDTTVPPAPNAPSVSSGDTVLYVSCTNGSGDSITNGAYKAGAVPTNSTLTTQYSNESSSCSLVVKGLTNDQSYDVVVYRLNNNHNPSVASASTAGTPYPSSDYWNQYKQDGGRGSGGCNTAAGAVGLLGALSLLVALRRRKS